MLFKAITSIFPYQAILLVALGVAFIRYRKIPLKALLPWLFFTCVIEIFISYYFMVTYRTNYLIVNLFSFISIYFFSCLYIPEIINKPIKKIIISALVLWTFVVVRKVIYMTIFSPLENQLYLIGLLIIMFQIIVYLYEFINDNYSDIKYSPKLILAITLLVFITCSFPLLIFMNSFLHLPDQGKAFTNILDIGNIILSLGYLGAALCIRKEQPSTK